MKTTTRQRYPSYLLFFFLLVCNAYVFPRWADPNQNSRLNMVVAVVEDGTFQIDNYVANTVDYAKVGDHYYSDKAPGAAFLGIPVYMVLKGMLDSPLLNAVTTRLENSSAFDTTLKSDGSGVSDNKMRFAIAQVAISLVVGALPSALIGVLLFNLSRRFGFSNAISLLIAIGYSLFTPAFAYANAFYGHQLSAALLFAAFYLIQQNEAKLRTSHLLLIGLLLGYSFITEYPTLLMAAILFFYAWYALLRQGRATQILFVMLSGGVIAIGWMAYNTVVFGGPLSLGYSHSELWTNQHATGFMSLTLPHVDALWGITFSRFRGLFLLAPWLLLALPGFYLWWRRGNERAAWWVSIACIISMFLFNASSGMWWGGYAVGPRYLLPALPFLALATTFAIAQWQRQTMLRVLLVLLLGWSWLLVWGMTLAGQAFAPDYLRDPLVEYALPNWQQANIARNVGTILEIRGVWSLLPLLLFVILGGITLKVLFEKHENRTKTIDLDQDSAVAQSIGSTSRQSATSTYQ